MKSRIPFFVLAMFFFSLTGCGKKEEEREKPKAVVVPEVGEIQVDIPEVSWEKSLAVAPLRGTLSTPEEVILSTMMREELASGFRRVRGLMIVSPSSAEVLDEMHGLDEGVDRETGLDYVLEGGVETEEGFTKVTFNLVDVAGDSVVWTRTYVEDLPVLLTVEERVADSVAGVLGLVVEEEGPSGIASVSDRVLEWYLEAKMHLVQGTREETDLAVQGFKEILMMDSTFVPACVGLAESYLQIVDNGWDRNLVWLKLAQEAGRRAVRLDGESAEGYLVLGRVYLAWGNLKQAEQAFRTALSLNPNLEEGWTGLGKIFSQYGLYEPCLDVYDKTLALNPAASWVSLSRALILTGLKRYRTAETEIRRALLFHPDEVYLHSFLALLLYYEGALEEALEEVQKGMAAEAYGPFSHAVLAMIYVKQGRLDEALGELELEVKPYVRNDGSLATAVAAIYALLGQNGQAVAWLDKAFSFGYREYPWLINDPNFEGLREDARFVDLMERVKEAWTDNMRRYEEKMNLPL